MYVGMFSKLNIFLKLQLLITELKIGRHSILQFNGFIKKKNVQQKSKSVIGWGGEGLEGA